MEKDAVAAVHQFAVGGAILVLLVSFVIGSTGSFGADRGATDAAVGEARAEALREIALSRAWSWDEGGSEAASGFKASDGSFDLGSIAPFKGAAWTAGQDSRIGYSEAQSLWGVQESDGFHLSIVPISATGLYDFSDLRVAYVGAWNDVAEVHVDLATDEQMVAGLRAQLDLSASAMATRERAILTALGADYDDRIHLTAAGPALLVDTVVPLLPPAGKAYVCHNGITILIDLSAVLEHRLHGDSVGHCPGQAPPGQVVSVPLLTVLGDVTLLAGDVYMDDVDYLAGAMASRWDEYDIVVVGSTAATQALGQGSFPAGLRDHVEGGGLLVVFGGTTSDAWLAHATGAIQETANQQPSTPAPQHPILTWPEAVDWPSMANGPALSAQRFPDATWQIVLAQDDEVQLALSPPGAYGGQGLLVATSMEPEGGAGIALATDIFAYYARQDLHLEFGPTVPAGTPVASSMATVWGTDLGGNQVALRVQVLYWRA